jgi:tetratricopeptide (TPR) repeat protein
VSANHAAILTLAFATTAVAQEPPPITDQTLRAVAAWVEAVRLHTPGHDDAALKHVAALTYDDRVQLDAGMALFLDGLLGNTYNTGRNPAAKAIVEHGRAAGAPNAAGFLKRAAVLHARAAAHQAPPDPRAPSAGGGDRSRGRADLLRRPPRVSPLLHTSPLPVTRDGELVSQVRSTWHLPFARYLLDLVGTREAPDPFVAAWYHATNAELFHRAAYGDMTSHLDHAEKVLPDNALILFDRGCYAEVLGLPVLQAVVPPPNASLVVGAVTGIPPASSTNAEAERLYRRALAVDSSLVEPRVRLARLLTVRQRYQEADAMIAVAVGQAPTGMLGFYSHLFAGRTSQAIGRFDAASRHYQSALRLFPDAQSALLAASQLALLQADVSSALAPIERLGDRSVQWEADPWRSYDYCAGRDADQLLQALWDRLPALR